jgi:hypothetical protein
VCSSDLGRCDGGDLVTPPPTWLYFPAAAAPWLPSDLDAARCWLDASDSTTITLSGSNITEWRDKIGSNHADDAVNDQNNKITTRRPTIATAAQNSLDAVNFGGSHWFNHNTARGLLRNRSHALMVAVMKYGSVSTSTFQFAWANRNQGTGTVAPRFQLLHRDTNFFSASSRRLDADGSGVVVDTSTNPPYNTDWHIHVASCNWGTGDFAYFVDGNQIGSTQTYPGSAGNTSDTDHGTTADTWTTIGNGSNSTSGTSLSNNSRIGALFCGAKSSGSYTTDDRQRLEGYFAHRWGLTSLLDNNHPYKNAAP